jgi:hypothetical protein
LPPYLLDTNIFIEPYRTYYAFDIAPRYWREILQHNSNGRVFSVDRVKDELERGADELTRWANEHFIAGFISTNETGVLQACGDIMAWATGQSHFTTEAKTEFADTNNADAWVIACARANGFTVVTGEVFDAACRRRIKIPNVCVEFGIPYVDTFQMLRNLGITLD